MSSTELEVTWTKLRENDTNDDITAYRVCYGIQESSVRSCDMYKDVDGINTFTYNLSGLNEATTYFVAVQAGTQIGFGEIENILSNRTLEDGKQYK